MSAVVRGLALQDFAEEQASHLLLATTALRPSSESFREVPVWPDRMASRRCSVLINLWPSRSAVCSVASLAG